MFVCLSGINRSYVCKCWDYAGKPGCFRSNRDIVESYSNFGNAGSSAFQRYLCLVAWCLDNVSAILEFFSSLGVIGWCLIALCILLLLNLSKLARLRSPLDSQEHRLWKYDRATRHPGRSKRTMKLDHLEKKDK